MNPEPSGRGWPSVDAVLAHSRRLAWFANWKDTATGIIGSAPRPGKVHGVPSIPTTQGASTNEDVLLVRSEELPIYLAPMRLVVNRRQRRRPAPTRSPCVRSPCSTSRPSLAGRPWPSLRSVHPPLRPQQIGVRPLWGRGKPCRSSTLAALGRGPNRLVEIRSGEELPAPPPLVDPHAFTTAPLRLTRQGARVLDCTADRVDPARHSTVGSVGPTSRRNGHGDGIRAGLLVAPA
jgi:hypothetical protein